MSTVTRISLTLLGIGGAFDADRGVANTNALLEIELGPTRTHRVLLDCGHTCGRQLHRLGLGYQDMDEVIITHTHGDHMDGLEVMGYKSRFLHHRRAPLLATPEVLRDIWRSLQPRMGILQMPDGTYGEASLESYYTPQALSTQRRTALAGGALEVQPFPVVHVVGMPCFGMMFYRAGEAAPLLRWSGDTIFDGDSPLFQGLEEGEGRCIFHDCLFYPHYPGTVHTHFAELAALPEALRRRTVLIHHGQNEGAPEPTAQMHLGQALERFPLWEA